MNVSINYDNISVTEIKQRFHLNELCPKDTAQLENIALALKLLFFECDLLKIQYPKDLEALLCREIIVLSYSILDGIVACMGFLMQDRCALCSHRCQYYSQTMYEENSIRENENKAFKNADAYLQKCKIINMTLDAQQFYRVYRDRRNNIHLSKNCEIITKDKCFTRSYSNQAVKFLSNFIDMLYENQREFVANNKCNSKQRRGI